MEMRADCDNVYLYGNLEVGLQFRVQGAQKFEWFWHSCHRRGGCPDFIAKHLQSIKLDLRRHVAHALNHQLERFLEFFVSLGLKIEIQTDF